MSIDADYRYCPICRAWVLRDYEHKCTNTTSGITAYLARELIRVPGYSTKNTSAKESYLIVTTGDE